MGRAWICCLTFVLASCAAFGRMRILEFLRRGREASLADANLQTAPPASGRGEVKQARPVQFVRLRRSASPFPVLMLPGGSLSGAAYETTPDGRPGWQSDFLRGGYSVAIADLGQVGRSPWSSFPALTDPPILRAKSFFWEVARVGPPGSYARDAASRHPYIGTRFPVAAFDALSRQVFARFRAPPAIEHQRYLALIERACPCIVVAHSAAGPAALTAAIERPDLIAALILVELPGGPPAADLSRAASARAFRLGDHVDADDECSFCVGAH